MSLTRILVVDDESFSRRMTQLVLEREGYQTLEARTGLEALELLAHERVDLVLSDVMMPEMNGLEMLVALRKTQDAVHLPVLLMTGLDDLNTLSQAFEASANDVLPKIAEQKWLLRRVAEQLELRAFRLAHKEQVDSRTRFALSPIGVWNWDLTQDRFAFSSRWKGLLGFSNEALPNEKSSWFGRVHPEDLPLLERQIEEHRARKNSCIDLGLRIQHASGAYVYAHFFGMALFDAKGMAVRMLGSMARIASETQADLSEWRDALARCKAALLQAKSERTHPLEKAVLELEALLSR